MHVRTITKVRPPVTASAFGDKLTALIQILTIIVTLDGILNKG